jgi:site-specific DNA recombinase
MQLHLRAASPADRDPLQQRLPSLRGAKYLVQGLVFCEQCGYAYYGKAISPSSRKHHPCHYAYYRCLGTDAYRFGGVRVCSNHQVRTHLLDWRCGGRPVRYLSSPIVWSMRTGNG